VSYVDAGYAVGLSTLAVYALSLVVRRRVLARRAQVPGRPDGAGGGSEGAVR
jgi:hypothetical protein